MATPPFGISTTTPGDTDIVSQFPANERTNRDEINSWLLVDHDTNGNHPIIHMPFQSSAPATPASSVGAMYVDINGNLIIKRSDGNLYYVGPPPGSMGYTAGSTADNGWALANGQAISRTGIGAALFARIGTTYGAGDGSTTFNVPDGTGRVAAGKEAVATRLTIAGSGVDGGTLGATGGAQNHVLAIGEIPAHNHTVNITDPGHSHTYTVNVNGGTGTTTNAQTSQTGSTTGSSTTGISATTANVGGGGAHPTVPPTIVLNAQIKL